MKPALLLVVAVLVAACAHNSATLNTNYARDAEIASCFNRPLGCSDHRQLRP